MTEPRDVPSPTADAWNAVQRRLDLIPQITAKIEYLRGLLDGLARVGVAK